MIRVGMIFAAGRGTRLGERGKTTPKALIPIRGEPMLKRIILRMKAAGVTELVINLHHLGSQIRDYVAAENEFGITINFSEEEELLDTGGGLKYARRYFEKARTILVHNADVYSDVDLSDLIRQHEESSALASLLVSDRESSRVLYFSAGGELAGWKNRKTGEEILAGAHVPTTEMAYGGIQLLSPEFLPFLDGLGDRFWLFDAYFNAVRSGNVVKAIDSGDSLWWDIGTPERIQALESELETN